MTPAELVRRHALTADDLVIQVGSGDGSFLRTVAGLGPRVLGVEADPTAVGRAMRAGVDTVCGRYDADTADLLRRRYGRARLVIGTCSDARRAA